MPTFLAWPIACLLGLWALCSPAMANLSVVNQAVPGSPDQVFVRIYIEGTITRDDSASLRQLVTRFDAELKDKWMGFVYLNSLGGNIEASLQIGTLLRERGIPATVDRGSVCMSSCVYVLAGASRRSVNQHAQIGIHRPYDPTDVEGTPAQQRAKQTMLGKMITDYLRSMNVPTRLYEDSVFVPPDRMKTLTPQDLQQYGLSENDPYVDEADEVRQAKRLGVTRAELGKRKAEARRRCGMDSMTDDTPTAELIATVRCYEDHLKRR